MKKQLLSIILSLLPMLANAYSYKTMINGVYYQLVTNTKTAEVISSKDVYTGNVNIPSTVTDSGVTYSVTRIGSSAFKGCSGLTSVTIPNSVSSIGESAFSGCSGLTSVTIPNTVTSIGESAFSGCSGLTSVTIPNTVTSIGESAFSGCSGLTSVTIPNNVEFVGGSTFYGCTSLTSITIPNSVTSIGDNAFYKCSGLTSIIIGNGVTSIGKEAFYGCSGLTSVTIPNSVMSIGENAFYGCSGLNKVIVSGIAAWCGINFGDYESNPLYYAHRLYSDENTEIKDLVIPNSVTSIGQYAFYSCYSLTSVTIPNSVTSIGYSAFSGCSGLTTINIPNSVSSIGNYAFYGCSGLKKVIVFDIAAWCGIKFGTPDGSSPLSVAHHLYSDENTEILELVIPDKVTSIGSSAFSGCSSLTSITIPNSVTSIGEYAFNKCSSLTSVTIGNSVTSIGDNGFSGCSGLTSITIPNSVTSIGSEAFNGCNNLTSVKVPVIDYSSFCKNKIIGLIYSKIEKSVHLIDKDGNEIKEYLIPEGVTSIGDKAFCNCSGLTSVTIPNSVTSIGKEAFSYCSNLWIIKVPVTDYSAFCNNKIIGLISANVGKSVRLINKDGNEIKEYLIPEDVTSIGSSAFRNCSGLTSVTIPTSVTNIEYWAFLGCSGLTSVTIPNSVTSIGNRAFSYCSGLTSVKFHCKVIGDWFSNLPSIKEITIGDEVTTIGERAFMSCSGLTSITIPNSVMSIGNYAFSGCSGLMRVKVPVTDYSAFCNNKIVGLIYSNIGKSISLIDTNGNEIKEYLIPEDVTSIGNSAFRKCSGLTSITIPNSVMSIGEYAFYGCSGLTSINIPNSVTSIGDNAFNGIANNASVTIGDNIASITSSMFPSSTRFYTKHKTKTLFALWNSSYKNNIYEQETSKTLVPPSLSSNSQTQTGINVTINNMYDEYTYEFNGEGITSNTITYNNLYPDCSVSCTLIVRYNDMSYSFNDNFNTLSLSPSIKAVSKTASSLSVNGQYTKGNAEIAKTTIKLNGKTIEGDNILVTGLNPNTSYRATYTVTVKYGDNLEYFREYTGSSDFKTDVITFTTQQPKVISTGNAIVAAELNVDNEENNVGFEWRRTDWTSDFASNTGIAYLFEGTMEGYIRNLNTDKLWKYRPYYLADNGTYYYGDWVGLDPTNVSYFEPTVHTYSQIGVKGNTASVKGYALGGSDEITVQGFMYWKNEDSSSNRVLSTDVPSTATTVEASGTIMEVNLSNLDYESSYSYVAFATTSQGTYYGEIKTFSTSNNPTGINKIKVENSKTASVYEIARYNMHGRRITNEEKGINIIKMSDGTTKKVIVK